nr:unnamed protein product [Callosobruchus analis]
MAKLLPTACFLVLCGIAPTASQDVAPPLLIDKLTLEFLKLEDELWNGVLNSHGINEIDSASNIVRRFYEFDKKLQQIPQEILYGLQVPKKTDPFLIFFSDVRIIHDAYEKFRRYQEQYLLPSRKDYQDERKQISVNNMIHHILYDEKNNINKTIQSAFDQLYGSTSMLGEILEASEFHK